MKFSIVPEYTEVNLFLAGATLFLLAFFSKSFSADVFLKYHGGFGLFIILSIGAAVAIVYAFIPKKTPAIAKAVILFFAVIINLFVASKAFGYIWDNTLGKNIFSYEVIFPIINLIYAGIILFKFQAGKIGLSSIKDDQAKLSHIIIGLIITIAIIVYGEYVNWFWAITYSVALTYSQLFLNLTVKPIEKLLRV